MPILSVISVPFILPYYTLELSWAWPGDYVFDICYQKVIDMSIELQLTRGACDAPTGWLSGQITSAGPCEILLHMPLYGLLFILAPRRISSSGSHYYLYENRCRNQLC